jgi:hypothetical protein
MILNVLLMELLVFVAWMERNDVVGTLSFPSVVQLITEMQSIVSTLIHAKHLRMIPLLVP